MKLSSDFVLRRVVNSAVLVPLGQKMVDFTGILSFNKVGAFLAELLQDETTTDALVNAVIERFDVDAETAAKDVDAFLEQLRANGVLEE